MSGIGADLLEDCSKHVDGGPATAWARLPMVERRVAGNRTSAVDTERSRRRESTSDSRWINSDTYCGAAPFRQRCTKMQSLYWMRSGTRSQCKFTSSGVTWSNLRASAVSRAALLQRSARTESDQGHAAAIQPGRRYSCRSWTWWTT